MVTDELIVHRWVDKDVLERDHDVVEEEARELMRSVQEKSAECAVDRKVSYRRLANLASVLFSKRSFFFDFDLFRSPLLIFTHYPLPCSLLPPSPILFSLISYRPPTNSLPPNSSP